MKLQDKNQVVAPIPPIEHEWASFKDQRRVNVPEDTSEYIGIPEMAHSAVAPTTIRMSHFNEMPPGYDATADFGDNTGPMPLSMAGSTDAAGNVNDSMLVDGFARLAPDMPQGTQRTFYEDMGGFVDRGNTCDRSS